MLMSFMSSLGLQPGLGDCTSVFFSYHFPSDFRDLLWEGLGLLVRVRTKVSDRNPSKQIYCRFWER